MACLLIWDRTATISIHALRGEGDARYFLFMRMSTTISIHALRGEGDYDDSSQILFRFISIHALRGEGDGFS